MRTNVQCTCAIDREMVTPMRGQKRRKKAANISCKTSAFQRDTVLQKRSDNAFRFPSTEKDGSIRDTLLWLFRSKIIKERGEIAWMLNERRWRESDGGKGLIGCG